MRFIKLTLPMILAFLFGMLGIAIQYVPHPTASDAKEALSLWIRLIAGIAFLLGMISLVRMHVLRVKNREQGWGYSLFFFLGFGLMTGATVYNAGQGFWNSPHPGSIYYPLYVHAYEPAAATMFSLLGFFIASAAVRTFRARSFGASLLLGSAILVMLGRAPLGEMISPYFPRIAHWIMAVPNAAAKRGLLLGISLGVMATSLRIIFGLERSYLGGQS